jgi:cytochrome c
VLTQRGSGSTQKKTLNSNCSEIGRAYTLLFNSLEEIITMKKILLPLLVLGAALSVQPAFATDAEALFKSKPCAACHNIDMKMVGPALKEVAAKYAGTEGAVELLAGRIKNGTQGNWGPMPMPANPVTDEEAKILAEWVLSLK